MHNTETLVLTHPFDLRGWRVGVHDSIALIPTMGALHEGHAALIHFAKQRAPQVIVSIFVNPTQFGRNEDYKDYPRSVEEDIAKLRRLGVNAVFIPEVKDMYPKGQQGITFVLPPPSLAQDLCGKARPGHFAGVTTIVTKLFNLIQPDVAVFGEKDYQQFLIIKKMVEDLNYPLEVVGSPIIRERDGLAISTRNQYLSYEERKTAPLFSRILKDLALHTAKGEFSPSELREAAMEDLGRAGFEVEYIELRQSDTLAPVKNIQGKMRWLAAVKLGKTRLIDNWPVSL